LGVAQVATGAVDAAIGSLEKAKDKDRGSAARYGNLATVYLLAGRTREAIDAYAVAVRLTPADAHLRSDLGTALLAANELTRAKEELVKAVELDPTRATFRSNLGYACQIEGRFDLAEAHYREALKLDPKLSSAWINLATVLARDPKRRTEARDALVRARTIDPSDPRVKPNLDELDALEKGR
jgi:Flp pilus assembly protein TadD